MNACGPGFRLTKVSGRIRIRSKSVGKYCEFTCGRADATLVVVVFEGEEDMLGVVVVLLESLDLVPPLVVLRLLNGERGGHEVLTVPGESSEVA